MDCVRVSTRELFDEAYMGRYNLVSQSRIPNKDECRQECVSDLGCKAWKYTSDNECYTSSHLYGKQPEIRREKSGTHAGLIKCENSWSMLRLTFTILIMGLILVGIWLVLTRVKLEKKGGGKLAPNFYFRGS